MGLPVRQRRVLGRIESGLRGSDPRLTALYSIFARLTRDEELPRIEQLRHGIAALSARLRGRLVALRTCTFGRMDSRQKAVLFFPLALCLMIATIILAVHTGKGPSCTPVLPVAAASQHIPPSKVCRNQPPVGLYAGRLGLST
jgi:hypothetical protein